jgi:hypothetical protein
MLEHKKSSIFIKELPVSNSFGSATPCYFITKKSPLRLKENETKFFIIKIFKRVLPSASEG